MGANRELPGWALPVIIVVCLVVVGWIGWRGLGGSGEVGPRREVHPGMYHIGQDAQKTKPTQNPAGGAQNE